MKKMKIGLLPQYLELYDKNCSEARPEMESFLALIAAEFKKRGVEVVAGRVCRLAAEFAKEIKSFENAGVQAGMPVGPLAVLDETSLTLSLHVMEQTKADFAAEGKTYTATPGELVVKKLVHQHQRPGRAGGAGFYEYPSEEDAKKIH